MSLLTTLVDSALVEAFGDNIMAPSYEGVISYVLENYWIQSLYPVWGTAALGRLDAVVNHQAILETFRKKDGYQASSSEALRRLGYHTNHYRPLPTTKAILAWIYRSSHEDPILYAAQVSALGGGNFSRRIPAWLDQLADEARLLLEQHIEHFGEWQDPVVDRWIKNVREDEIDCVREGVKSFCQALRVFTEMCFNTGLVSAERQSLTKLPPLPVSHVILQVEEILSVASPEPKMLQAVTRSPHPALIRRYFSDLLWLGIGLTRAFGLLLSSMPVDYHSFIRKQQAAEQGRVQIQVESLTSLGGETAESPYMKLMNSYLFWLAITDPETFLITCSVFEGADRQLDTLLESIRSAVPADFLEKQYRHRLYNKGNPELGNVARSILSGPILDPARSYEAAWDLRYLLTLAFSYIP